MRKVFLIIMLVGMIITAAGYFQKRMEPPQPEISPLPTSQMPGSDMDEHGCKSSAGYSFCEPKNKCLRIWEESCYISAAEELKYRLADIHGKQPDQVSVKISKQEGDFLAGSVTFGQADDEGGMILARKQGNMWEIVFEGNGNVDCGKLRGEYGFPDKILKPNYCD